MRLKLRARPTCRIGFCAVALALAWPGSMALAEPSPELRDRIEAILAQAPTGTRFGVLVVDDAGNTVVAINPDQRFVPASNTKLFTTAAALELLGTDAAMADALGATTLSLVPAAKGPPDLVLTGGGAALSTAADCTKRCLGGLLSGIALKTHKVGNIVADDTAFTDQRWSPGMSWNNIATDSGTAVSALVIDDNALPLLVKPTKPGKPADVIVSPYYTVRNETRTIAVGVTEIGFERLPLSRELRVFGTIRSDAGGWTDRLGIDDPADFAAWSLREGLTARGIRVSGSLVVRHRSVASEPSDPDPPRLPSLALAVNPAPLDEEVAAINKPSQNLHAEVLLRRLGRAMAAQDILVTKAAARGTLEAGLKALQTVLDTAGIARSSYDFADGSGMSSYNRISPRAAVTLLRWGARRPWAAAWRASLPVGGIDGTLRRRFAGTSLEGKVWAKTGTLNATNALSGFVQASSGRELTFSILANDVPGDGSAAPAIDAAIEAIAAAN